MRREDADLEDGTRITLVPADPLAATMGLESRTEGAQFTVRVFAGAAHDFVGRPWIQFRLTAPDGNSTRGGEDLAGPNEDLDDARTMLQKVPGGWHPRLLRGLSGRVVQLAVRRPKIPR